MEWIILIGFVWYLLSKIGGGSKTSTSPAPVRGPTILDPDFTSSFSAWRADMAARFDRSAAWVPGSAAEKYAVSHPPPTWKGSSWANPNGSATPADLVRAEIKKHNDAFLIRKKAEKKAFFDTVEKNPLTDEQVHACICMDDNC